VDSTISDNRAVAGPGEYANGGGIVDAGSATLTLTNSAVVGNLCLGGDGASGTHSEVGSALGGGIDNEAKLYITDSTIADNRAVAGNGGQNGTTTEQQIRVDSALGGGIKNGRGSTLTLVDSTICGNVAQAGVNNAGVGGTALGGGILDESATVNIKGTVFAGNRAIGGNGGAAGVAGGPAAGGGLDITELPGSSVPASATVSDSLFFGNQAIGGNGGSGTAGGTAVGGAINVGLISAPPAVYGSVTDTSTLTLTDNTLDYNVAQGGNGADGGDGLGGGLAIQANASATLSASTITLNQAIGGPTGIGGTDGQGVGGGVYNLGKFVYDLATVIARNHASTSNNDIFPT
jgi:hypothetical protein